MKALILSIALVFLPAYSEEKIFSYFIAIKKNLPDEIGDLETFTPLVPPKGRFYADPFICKYEGVNYLFFEDCNYKKGVISYVILDDGQVVTSPSLALEEGEHLSFPHVFQDDEDVYMTPETYRSRCVFLYKAVKFPSKWKRERVLVRGRHFSDPMLFKHNGYYWLFVATKMERLSIYYAKDLKSVFYPHPINALSLKGRNAGPVFFMKERMIRPVMDCTKKYGKAVILKEIMLLTTTEFVEREFSRIEPDWAPELEGTHTYSQNEDYLAYDGEILVPVSD